MTSERLLALSAAAGVALVLALAASGLTALAQTPDDPETAPIPTIEPFSSAESIVIEVVFQSPTEVEFVRGTVSLAPPPALIGGPPLIKIEVFDVSGQLLEEFNEWHPLWVEAIDESGDLEMIVEDSGEGRFVFAFAPDIGTVTITDIELNQELIEIDARQIVLAYCAGSPGDPGCKSVPDPGQLPGTGGAAADDGSSDSLLWIAAIAAAMVAATGGAAWLAHERRRAN